MAQNLRNTLQVILESKGFKNFKKKMQGMVGGVNNTVGKVNNSFGSMKENTTSALQNMENGINNMRDTSYSSLHKVMAANDSFLGSLSMSHEKWKAVNKESMNFSSVGGKVGNITRHMTQGFKKFRMELLSVMFFGMALQRTMFGLLKPAMETTGIFELLSITLQMLFLPLAMMLLDFLMPIMEYFWSLDESTRKVIGAIVLFAGILGGLLMVLGTLGLGIGGLIELFGFIEIAAGAIAGVLSVGLVVALAAVVVAVIAFYDAWKENFLGIRDFVSMAIEGIKNIFSGLWDFLGGLLDVIVGAFQGDTDKIKEGFSKMGEGIKKMFRGLIQFLTGLVATLGITLINALKHAAIGMANVFYSLFVEPVVSFVEMIIDRVKQIMKHGLINVIKRDFIRMINFLVRRLNSLISTINLIPGFNLGKVGTLDVPRLGGGRTRRERTSRLEIDLILPEGAEADTDIDGDIVSEVRRNTSVGG